MKFQKKPVVIEAIQWTGLNIKEVLEFADFNKAFRFVAELNGTNTLKIETLEGDMKVSPGDWVIRGAIGEFYPCKPEAFAASFEEPTKEGTNLDFFEATFKHSDGKEQTIHYRKSAVRSVTTNDTGTNPTIIVMDHHGDGEYDCCTEPTEEILKRLVQTDYKEAYITLEGFSKGCAKACL